MGKANPITEYHLTDHVRFEMTRRLINVSDIARVLSAPEQMEIVREGRVIYQARMESGEPPKTYLYRVVVDVDHKPPEVVTVYRTSKIAKYWRAIS